MSDAGRKRSRAGEAGKDEAEVDIVPASADEVEPEKTKEESRFGELFQLDPESATDKQLHDIMNAEVRYQLARSPVAAGYNVLFLYDDASINRSDADRIYNAIGSLGSNKPILLLMYSPGGDVASAYLIATLCREYSGGTFEVAIPRQAKSAATLIACGADRIHMGSLSELGPIDPQFGAIPALALKHSVEHIAALVTEHPGAAEMFANYLSRALRVESLGYYERVAESAAQYAVRLLKARTIGTDRDHTEIARRLVYDYKDHGFVIDYREATDIFGEEIVKADTPEYDLANQLYGVLDLMEWVVGQRFQRHFSFTGSGRDGCLVYPRRD